MGPTRINGLPAHVLLVHVVVAMVPITALLLLLTIFWPEARRRIGVALPVVALFTLITVPITTHAGEWLEDHLGGSSPLIAKHADLGDQLLPWAIATFVISAVVWGVNFRYARTAPGGRPPAALNIALAVLAVVVAIGSVVMVYRIGDSGAKATWQGTATGGS